MKLLNDFQAGQLIVKAPGPLVSRLTLQAFTKHKHPLIRKHIGAKTECHFNDIILTRYLPLPLFSLPHKCTNTPAALLGVERASPRFASRPINYETNQL